MRKYLSLTRVLLHDLSSAFDIKFGGKDNKWAGPVLWAVIGVCMLPLLGLFYVLFQGMYLIFASVGQLAYVTGLIFNMLGVVIFFFSILSAPAIFYFSKEVEYLLPLPLAPEQITGAKFTVALLLEYVVALFVIGPMYAAYISYLPAGTLTVNMLLTFLTLPIAPLVYSTVVIMVLMRVSRFGRNRDRYNMLVGLIGVVIGLGIGMFSSRLNTFDAAQVEALISGNQTAFNALRSLFPGNIFAGEAVANGDLVQQLINIVINAAILGAFFLLARLLYFKGVIGLSESSGPSKKMTRAEIVKNTRGQSVFRSYLQKEFRLLFRNPTAFMNCVLMVLLMPLLMGVMIFMNLQSSAELINIPAPDFNDGQLVAYVYTGAAAIGFLISAMNLVTSTALSREGSNFIIMKYIPVSYRTQLNAKTASGVVVSLLGLIIIMIGLEVVFKAPPVVFISVCLLTLPGTVILNYLGLLIDLLKPKLTWDNEQRAVKQNLNVMFLMLIGMVMTVAVVVAGMLWLHTPVTAFIGQMLLGTALSVAVYFLVMRVGEAQMAKLSV